MDEHKLVQVLEGMNAQHLEASRRLAATELLLIGVLRGLGNEADLTLQIERSLAEFATGNSPLEVRKAVTALARSILEAAYEPPPVGG